MLRIYPVSQKVAQEALRIADEIARKDRDLANQLRRAATSTPLNIAEGAYSQGGNRNARYHTAMASAAETRAILETAEGAGWIAKNAERDGDLRRIIGTLVRVLKLR
jgi:four helix bundle protein